MTWLTFKWVRLWLCRSLIKLLQLRIKGIKFLFLSFLSYRSPLLFPSIFFHIVSLILPDNFDWEIKLIKFIISLSLFLSIYLSIYLYINLSVQHSGQKRIHRRKGKLHYFLFMQIRSFVLLCHLLHKNKGISKIWK